jgi:CheY-like chemotaxis protein
VVAGPSSPVIVLADADRDFLAFVSDLLEPAGYPTIAVSSGEEVLATVRREDPCLLVLDVGLPGLSGYEVCRQLRDELETNSRLSSCPACGPSRPIAPQASSWVPTTTSSSRSPRMSSSRVSVDCSAAPRRPRRHVST